MHRAGPRFQYVSVVGMNIHNGCLSCGRRSSEALESISYKHTEIQVLWVDRPSRFVNSYRRFEVSFRVYRNGLLNMSRIFWSIFQNNGFQCKITNNRMTVNMQVLVAWIKQFLVKETSKYRTILQNCINYHRALRVGSDYVYLLWQGLSYIPPHNAHIYLQADYGHTECKTNFFIFIPLCLLINVWFYYQNEHNPLNIKHQLTFYNMFRPFVSASTR